MLLSPRTHVEAFLELEDLWEWTPMRTPYPSVHLALPEHPNWPVRVSRMVRVFSDASQILGSPSIPTKSTLSCFAYPLPTKDWKVYRMLDSFFLIFVEIFPQSCVYICFLIKHYHNKLACMGKPNLALRTLSRHYDEMLMNELELCQCSLAPGPGMNVYELIV